MKLIFASALVIIFSFTIEITNADNIEIQADEWCPYTCQPNSDREGYLIDIARTIFEPIGHKITYVTTPWNRALNQAKNMKTSGLRARLLMKVTV